jgi:hypothetical protein
LKFRIDFDGQGAGIFFLDHFLSSFFCPAYPVMTNKS